MTKDSQAWQAFCDAMDRLHREQEKLRRKLNACINCKKHSARATSLYCSEACKKAFLTFEETR